MARPNLAEVLAHLNILVTRPRATSLGREDPEKDIHNVLVEVAKSLENRYSVVQIRRCLWDAFRTGWRYPENNFRQLFLHGSSEIPDLDSETVRSVSEHLEVLRLRQAYSMERSLRSGPRSSDPVTVPKGHRKKSSTPLRRRRDATTVNSERRPAQGAGVKQRKPVHKVYFW